MATTPTEEVPHDELGEIRPRHWLPIIFYFDWLITLRYASAIADGAGIGFDLEFAIDLMHLGACGALVGLASLLQVSAAKRLAMLLALWLLFSLIECVVLLMDDRSLPPSGYLHELARAALEKLKFIAILAALTQALSAALAFFVTTSQPTEQQFAIARQSKIADWLLWMLLFSLCFLPTLRQWRPPPAPSEPILIDGEFFFPEIIYAVVACGLLGMVLWGPFVIATGISSRLRFLIFALVVITSIGAVIYVVLSLQGAWSLAILGGATLYSFVCTLPAIPSWLLLRCAGYRLYSSRHGIYNPNSNQIKQVNMHQPPATQ